MSGIFALNMEEGNDNVVQASALDLPLVIFGGEGNNTIYGGQGGDTIIGHEGLVDYTNAAGTLITRLGLGFRTARPSSPASPRRPIRTSPIIRPTTSFIRPR